ncbi:N-acetylornithine carbamoyltransferase [Gammaproteobacteria bacterium]|nr:N-acetylornithine carbamoyltransferase [Gammaproteobacteria bacterium]MDC3383726.1 N-acetylornithine carbamoyltransferase [Gammaproteobacteria bacterium]
MKNFISTQDWSKSDLQDILDYAKELKVNKFQDNLKNKSIALMFFNPSMRTRTSFELGIQQLGGLAVVLHPGKDAWPIEFKLNEVMDTDSEEHIIEVAKVLSEYCDLIAIRAFPKFINLEEDLSDNVIKSFAKYATVPVVNMETITHPCQELAHILTMQEQLGDLSGKDYLLTWTYHPKPLNTAVANSSLLIASKFGMNVKLLCPTEDYLLHDTYMQNAEENCNANGTSFSITHDIKEGYKNADVVYAKSWGALSYYGNPEDEKLIRDRYKNFIVNEEKMAMTNNAKFSHCLPLRRNIKATDGVMDSDYCVAIQEAGNRMHVQKSLLSTLLKDK